ncbi:hypothetical protein T10_334 [Trichinella papuae]|uniref:Uncharacterized protein n=1 Tax=Trichinella papuae TaxID=268474 RepID=A0A0V1MBN9_9BILA|nr:hypothetical protein T10_334 [Trichinella papuae]
MEYHYCHNLIILFYHNNLLKRTMPKNLVNNNLKNMKLSMSLKSDYSFRNENLKKCSITASLHTSADEIIFYTPQIEESKPYMQLMDNAKLFQREAEVEKWKCINNGRFNLHFDLEEEERNFLFKYENPVMSSTSCKVEMIIHRHTATRANADQKQYWLRSISATYRLLFSDLQSAD